MKALLCLLPGLLLAVERGEEIRLWPKGAPGSEGITAEEKFTPSKAAKFAKLPGNFTGQFVELLSRRSDYFLTSEKYFATVRTKGRASGGVATSPFRICSLGWATP